MNCPEEQTLNDYVDGELDTSQRQQVRDHLEDCTDCRTVVSELHALLRSATELPRDLAPSHYLFPSIRLGLEENRSATAGVPHVRWWMALAASLLLFSAVVLTASLMRGDRAGQAGVARSDTTALQASRGGLDEFQRAELEYIAATERLLTALEQRGEDLSPEARQIVEQNLQIIDRAIARVRQTYGEDPDPARGAQTLNALYRQKIKLLWRASRLSS